MRKHTLSLVITILLCFSYSCEKDSIESEDSLSSETEDISLIEEEEEDYIWNISESTGIILDENSVSMENTDSGVLIENNIITLTAGGMYSLSGSLSDGQLVVDTEDKEDVKIILNNADINCSTSAAIFVRSAEKVILILADNTSNTLSDGASYQDQDDGEPNATLFSKSYLSVCGEGSLSVSGNYNDGISGKDGLIIKNGNITIDAKDDGIRGKDYLWIHNGNISIDAGGDGLKSDNDANESVGIIKIDTINLGINAQEDGISAESIVSVSGGIYTITSGGGSSVRPSSNVSSKGIKAGSSLLISDGDFTINSSDDALHSNSGINLKGGTIKLSSGDDGIHAEDSILIINSTVDILTSNEGIESANINLDNSTVRIVSDDDGFNATYGNGGGANDNSNLNIFGGYICVFADGDALDSNGNIFISGGTVIAHGPSETNEVGMDCNGLCEISGGNILISGSNSFMTEAPATSSEQNSLLVIFSSSLQAGTLFHIQDNTGKEIISFAPEKEYASIIFSSPDLQSGSSYNIYTGGEYSGTEKDGIYSEGTYSPGTFYESYTQSGTVTILGSSNTSGSGHTRW